MNTWSINQKIIALWEKERKNKDLINSNFLKRVPQFFIPECDPAKKSILYVGLNPSFSDYNFNRVSKKIDDTNPQSVKRFYLWSKEKITRNYLNQLEKINREFEEVTYFKKAKKEIANPCNLNLLATDLFLMRETSQKVVKEIIYTTKKQNELSSFAKRQIEIFFEIVHTSQPRIILVGNALASKIIKEYLSLKLLWNDGIGTYTIKIGRRNIPIFFSGMLSGQRALDNHSFERLAWQIKRCVNKK